MNRAERKASKVAALVRAMGVPCRKVPRRPSVRCLWSNPMICALRHYHRWSARDMARLFAASAMNAIREDHEDTERTRSNMRIEAWARKRVEEMGEEG